MAHREPQVRKSPLSCVQKHARAQAYQKRGVGVARIAFVEALFMAARPVRILFALDDALAALEKLSTPRSPECLRDGSFAL
jgi:hypothetical protein